MALQRRVNPEEMNKDKKHDGSDSESQTSAKKRKRDNNDDDDIVLSPEVLAKMSRSERKRHREKKRRSDVNKGFDDLMNLLLEIDPVVRAEAEDRARRGQWKGNLGAQEDNLLSRVELIGRTVDVLRRVHKENEERKLIIEQLLQQKTTTPAPSPYGMALNTASDKSNDDILQNLAGLASLPQLRAEQLSRLQNPGVSSFFQPQAPHNAGNAFSNVNMLTFASPQMQSLSNFQRNSILPSQGQAQASASLLDQLVAERDAAAAFARARSQYTGAGKSASNPN